MEYLFTPESELPQGIGFQLYGTEHLAALGMILILTVFGLLVVRHLNKQQYRLLFRCLTGSMLLLELVKDMLLVRIGSFSVGYLPLHLCSLSMFYCVFAAWSRREEAWGRLLCTVCLPAALCALLFPDWTDFPILHFQSIHSFLWHGILLFCSLLPVIYLRIRPSIATIWHAVLLLLFSAIPVYGIDRLLHTNYMFLLGPSVGSPLVALADGVSHRVYLCRLALLAVLVVSAVNAVHLVLWKCVCDRKPRKK